MVVYRSEEQAAPPELRIIIGNGFYKQAAPTALNAIGLSYNFGIKRIRLVMPAEAFRTKALEESVMAGLVTMKSASHSSSIGAPCF